MTFPARERVAGEDLLHTERVRSAQHWVDERGDDIRDQRGAGTGRGREATPTEREGSGAR